MAPTNNLFRKRSAIWIAYKLSTVRGGQSCVLQLKFLPQNVAVFIIFQNLVIFCLVCCIPVPVEANNIACKAGYIGIPALQLLTLANDDTCNTRACINRLDHSFRFCSVFDPPVLPEDRWRTEVSHCLLIIGTYLLNRKING